MTELSRLAALVCLCVFLGTVPPGCLSLTPEATKYSVSQVTMRTIACSCDESIRSGEDIMAVQIRQASADDNSTGNSSIIVAKGVSGAKLDFMDNLTQKYCVADTTQKPSLNLTCMDPAPDRQPFLRGRELPPDLGEKLASQLFCECIAMEEIPFRKPHLSWATAVAFECFAEFENGRNLWVDKAELILTIPALKASASVPSFRSSEFNTIGKEPGSRKYVWKIDENITHPWREAKGKRLGLLVIVGVDDPEAIQLWKRSASCLLVDSVAMTNIPCGNCQGGTEEASVPPYPISVVSAVAIAFVSGLVVIILGLCSYRKARAWSRSYRNKARQCESVQEEAEFQNLHEPP